MKIILALMLCLTSLIASATAQMGDILNYDGERQAIFSNPLELYFDSEHPRPNKLFKSSCTANWRGYVAEWEIKDDFLYLVKLTVGSCLSDEEIPISKVFPKQTSPIKATWFTGIIRVPQGERINYVHMGYGSTYEQDLFLKFEKGKLVQKKVIDNRNKPTASREEKVKEELQKLEEWENKINESQK